MAKPTAKPKPAPVRPGNKLRAVSHQKGRFSLPSWGLLALLVFTAAVFARSVFNGFANLDDDTYILNNPYIREFTPENIKAIFSSFYFANYHPLTTFSYLLEYSLFGPSPWVFHLTNLVLHLANTWLVYKVAEKLSGQRLTGWICAALFALHPMHVESVAWVSERKDMLYTFFYLLALYAYLFYLDAGMKMKWLLAVFGFFLLSLLSKSAAVTFPVLLIAIDIYKRRSTSLRAVIEKLPFFMLSLLFGVMAILSQRAGQAMNEIEIYYSIFDRIFLVSYAITFYLFKAVFPFYDLCVMHYYPEKAGNFLPWEYYASLPFLLLLSYFVYRVKTFRRELVFGFMFFLICISVMLQIISVGPALVSERYTYVSYIGLFYIAGQWLSCYAKPRVQRIGFVFFMVMLLLFSGQTWVRIGVWKNGETLLADVIRKNPDNYIAYWIRANIMKNRGDVLKAVPDYSQALRCKPDFFPALKARADAYIQTEDYRSALADLTLAIDMEPDNAALYSQRSKSFYETGDLKAALSDCETALRLDSTDARAYNNRGLLRARNGDIEGGLKDINKALKYGSGDAESYAVRANILFLTGDFAGSLNDYNMAISLKPDKPSLYFNRGYARMNLNDMAGCCADWRRAAEMHFKPAQDALKQHCP